MEVFATIGTISSLVQLVDFSSKCIAKSVRLYQAESGVLDENAAIECALNHLVSLKNELEIPSAVATDRLLQELCIAVTETTSELVHALEKLKVRGENTRWETMRKAIRSVWSKDKVRELEGRLDSFRSELNLHVSVRTRQQLCSLESHIASNLDSSNEMTKRVITAILSQESLFVTKFGEHETLLHTLIEDFKSNILDDLTLTRTKLVDAITEADHIAQRDHMKTREAISTAQKVSEQNTLRIHKSTIKEVQAVRVEFQDAAERRREEDLAAHEITQGQIAELNEAVQMLSAQIRDRDEELKGLLVAFHRTKNPRKMKELGERSNAVTSALLALETMHRTLKTLLPQSQPGTRKFVFATQPQDLFKITAFAHRVTTSASKVSGNDRDCASRNRNQPLESLLPYNAYFVYRYFWPRHYQTELIAIEDMEKKWPIRKYPDSDLVMFSHHNTLWLLVAVSVALRKHLSPETASYTLINETLRRARQRQYRDPCSNWDRNLKTDFEYWTLKADSREICCSRGGSEESSSSESILPCHGSEKKFQLDKLSLRERRSLDWMLDFLIGMLPLPLSMEFEIQKLGTVIFSRRPWHSVALINSPAYVIFLCLQSMHVNLKVYTTDDPSNAIFLSGDLDRSRIISPALTFN
ncbi:hypothetical protein CC78DRAFT_566278 [Lojkania enalia]|uniref:Fungal N-terminal domain-containing protein n=1 Tax=Lojkania enalia TaxID=147567 RepID=A0A9P4KGM2_9PLEO|nr:hypothetical protein CC78DRAFT_566278 [Didymosphaeria enalia]